MEWSADVTWLVIGASGMLGFAVHRVLHDRGMDVVGTVRGEMASKHPWCAGLRLHPGVDVTDLAAVDRALRTVRPDVIVNAAGVLSSASGIQGSALLVNSRFPRWLALRAGQLGIRLVHFSTDGVFAGRRGGYDETHLPDADDVYGVQKFLGEPTGPGVVVLRTSLLGRGLVPNRSLVDWFLGCTGTVRGFRRAVFSGLPVNEIGRVLADCILGREKPLEGLFHLSAEPIAKYDLLVLMRSAWAKVDVEVVPDDGVVLDRSLDSARLRETISYSPPTWDRLISDMRDFYRSLGDTR